MPSSFSSLIRNVSGWSLLLIGMAARVAAASLDLQVERSSPFDLEISAGLVNVPEGESRFVAWDDIAALPSSQLDVVGEFVPGEQTVSIVMLDELRAALPVSGDRDTVIAYCTDGYFSIFQPEWIAEKKPFLITEINGQGPSAWPPEGLAFNPGPYVISMSDQLAPGVSQILDVGHKRPWGVDEIQFVSLAEYEAPARTGAWRELSPRAIRGRELWINSCSSCHQGPQGLAGGSKSNRPFPVLAAHAKYNDAYFRNYVRDPTGQIAGATMQPHPHYTEEEMDELIAFIVAETVE